MLIMVVFESCFFLLVLDAVGVWCPSDGRGGGMNRGCRAKADSSADTTYSTDTERVAKLWHRY